MTEQPQKNNFKKTFFFICLDSKEKPAKNKQNACFVFVFLSKLVFFLCIFYLPESTDKLFFFEQNHFKINKATRQKRI